MKTFSMYLMCMIVAVVAFQFAPSVALASPEMGFGAFGLLFFGTTGFEEVKALFEQFKAKNDEELAQIKAKGHADPLLKAEVDRMNEGITALEAKMQARIDDVEAAAKRPGAGLSAEEKAKAEYKAGFNAFARRGEIQAALSVGSDPDGGYAVPIEVDRNIMSLERNAVTMRRLANVISLGTPNYTKLVNKGGATSGWVGETDARAETGTPSLAALTPFWGEIYANPAATQAMLDDSFFDVEAWLANELQMDFAAAENAKFIAGNGVACPKGILAYTTALTGDATRAFGTIQHVVTGQAAVFETPSATVSPCDCLIDLQTALKPVFANNATWLMRAATLGIVRKFKDAVNGDYIYQPSMILGQPATLLGKPVELDEEMPAVGANSLAIAYGDFKRAYTIADRIGTRVLRDPFTNKPYVMFYTTKRVGGFLTDSNAVKLLKVSA